MTEQETDAMLRQVLLDALALECRETEDLPDCEPSPRHQKQMRAMCRDPLAWSRRRARPAWKTALRTAAMLALVCALSLAALLTASPSARAALKRWFVEYRERDVVYMYAGDPIEGELPRYTLSEIPDGYVLEDTFETPNNILHSYRCVTGTQERKYLYFEYLHMQEGAAMSILGTEATVVAVSVNGHTGTLYLFHDPDQVSSNLIWFDEENDLQFMLSGFLTQDELLKLAQSVIPEF